MKIVYFGTPEFSAKVLGYLIDNGIDVVAVVTAIDKAKGRSGIPTPSPVKALAMEKIPGADILQPTKLLPMVDTLSSYDADMFVCVAYGKIIPEAVLALPRLESINLHTSLLPRYRGAAPIHRAIISGEKVSGVTIMKMVKELDAGDIISVVETPIGENTTFGDLEETLCVLGSKALLTALYGLENGTATMTPQDHSLMTYAAKISVDDSKVLWESTAEDIHNLVRGVTPSPGAWCMISVRGKLRRLKILSTLISENAYSEAAPGTILSADDKGIIVACSEGTIAITSLQLEGKKPTTAEEFLRGFPIDVLSFIS